MVISTPYQTSASRPEARMAPNSSHEEREGSAGGQLERRLVSRQERSVPWPKWDRHAKWGATKVQTNILRPMVPFVACWLAGCGSRFGWIGLISGG